MGAGGKGGRHKNGRTGELRSRQKNVHRCTCTCIVGTPIHIC